MAVRHRVVRRVLRRFLLHVPVRVLRRSTRTVSHSPTRASAGRRVVVRAIASVMVLVLVLALAVAPATTVAAATNGTVDYRAPSDAPVVDRFRPPPQPWMAGNRGIDYGTEPGAPVHAAADGRVVFAGTVAGTLHVTLLHDDGLRTSYSFLASITVAVGERVRAGDVVAVADGPFHFGVRAPDDSYLDPEQLLAGRLRPSVRLVPGTDDGLDALGASERRSLLGTIVGGGVAALHALGSMSDEATALLLHYAVELHPATHLARVADALREWERNRDSCTDPSTPVPAHDGRRIVVVVSGLGTSSASNTALEIDTATLGYAPEDVVPYSYAGGRAPRRDEGSVREVATGDPFAAVPRTEFDALDSQRSISESADDLSVLLQEVAAAQPGVPIDVVAHSQGGVVARLAVERSGDAGRLPDAVETLVTVSSPQQGAPLATAVRAVGDSIGGRSALSGLRATGVADELDDRLPAIDDLAETSSAIDEMRTRSVPDRVRFVTIGASGDLVVPGTSAVDPAADASVILPSAVGTEAHGSVPSSPPATREIGLAVAGRAPTCRSLGAVLGAALTAESVRWGEAAVGAAAATAASAVPVRVGD